MRRSYAAFCLLICGQVLLSACSDDDDGARAPDPQTNWFDSSRSYRVPVEVSLSSATCDDTIAEFEFDFRNALSALGDPNPLAPESLLMVEVDATGDAIGGPIPLQFDPLPLESDPTQDSETGTVVLLATNVASVSSTRRYQLYFDTTADGPFTAPVVTSRLDVDTVTDEGQQAFRVRGQDVTWYYHRFGAAFSSILDKDGNDWVGYSPAPNGTGAYRGIPNTPGGTLSPGSRDAISEIVSSGPLRVVVSSQSLNGVWQLTWTFYPCRARMDLTQAPLPYWFAYEGTPGGELDLQIDRWHRSDGISGATAQEWGLDLADPEWVGFSDGTLNRSILLVQHQANTVADFYRPLQSEMTVFSFGRSAFSPGLTAIPAQFSVALVEGTSVSELQPSATDALRMPEVAVGDAERFNEPNPDAARVDIEP